MQVALHNNVKIYNLTAGKSLPEWLAEKKKNRAAAGAQRIELIHDLEFPHFTKCIFRTANGSYLFAAGDYPPRLKCYDVNEMSMKYSFNADMSINSGVSLSPDFRKFALRGDGRVLTIHHSAVIIDRVRVPHAQRGLTYHEHSCELLSPGSSHEIFRLSLDAGSFVDSFKTASSKGVNHVDYFQGSGLIVGACENGTVEAFDARQAKAACQLVVSPRSDAAATNGAFGFASEIEAGHSVTHVATDSVSGLHMCAGTSSGCVALYDIRSSKPLLVKDHMNGLPIVKTYFYRGGAIGAADAAASGVTGTGALSSSSTVPSASQIVSADTRSVKIWAKEDGSNFTTIETPATVYDFTFLRAEHNLTSPYEAPDSGVICVCCDTPRVQVHFIPQLGVAPRWCSFLDSITEELEEKEAQVVYDDFKFVSKEEFETLGLSSDEVAEGKVRPYMHGFFIENRLYREIKAVVDPRGFNRYAEEMRKKKKQDKLDGRISKFKRVDANAEAAEGDITENVHGGATDDALAAAKMDPRFASKLKDESFAVDKTKQEYSKLVKLVEERRAEAGDRHRQYENTQFTIVPDHLPSDEEQAPQDEDDEEADLPASMRKSKKKEKQPQGEGGAARAGGDGVAMFAAKSGANVGASDRQLHEERKKERQRKLTLEEQLQKRQQQGRKRGRH